MKQRMRIQVEHDADLGAAPQSLYRGERRIDITEIMDQWYGPGYRYVKVRGRDSSVYILLFDENPRPMGANHVLSGERPATSNASGITWPVQPKSSMSSFQI
jgi:hypothetical protein